eukprot:5408578-Amphidinium_carterae.1
MLPGVSSAKTSPIARYHLFQALSIGLGFARTCFGCQFQWIPNLIIQWTVRDPQYEDWQLRDRLSAFKGMMIILKSML